MRTCFMDSGLVMHSRYNSFTFDPSGYKGPAHLKDVIRTFDIKMFVLQLSRGINIAKCVHSPV